MTATVEALKGKLAEMESRNEKNTRMIEELEEQLQSNFDEAQITNNRISTLQTERDSQLEEINNSRLRLQAELEAVREEYAALQVCFTKTRQIYGHTTDMHPVQAKYEETTSDINRSSVQSAVRKSASHTSLPSPPPVIPLPPLPNGASAPGTPNVNGHPPSSPTSTRPPSKDNFGALSASQVSQLAEDQEARIRTIKKHLDAERQLTQTLEEALTDLEKQSNKVKADCEAWKKRASELELEVKELKEKPAQEAQDNRWSLQAVEEERKKRQAAEAARKQLEDRMNAINKTKKKKGSLNCF
jgi:kinesin family protein 4/21/27